jgi:hypothetical protein
LTEGGVEGTGKRHSDVDLEIKTMAKKPFITSGISDLSDKIIEMGGKYEDEPTSFLKSRGFDSIYIPRKGWAVIFDPADVKIIKEISQKNIMNLSIEDSIGSIVKQYLESNVDSTLSTVSSSHIIGALTAKGNLQENPMVSFDLLRQQSLDYAMEHTKEIIEKGG